MGKRGKKRQRGKREANGRLSRAPAERAARFRDAMDGDERVTISVATEARQRVHGVKANDARNQMAGTFVGRLCIQGEITAAQYDAAMMYLEERADYLAAIDAPRQPGAVDLNATHGRPVGAEDQSRTKRAVERFDATTKAIQRQQDELRMSAHLNGAIDAILVRDVDASHLIGDLRAALNALSRHYQLNGRERGRMVVDKAPEPA